ncbi:MAG: SDR family oxidoreductase [Candidatus Nanopelagicaceae bacterium]
MTIYAISGASGHLGRLAIEALLAKGVAASDIVALVRTPSKVADMAEQGIQVRRADYSQPDTLSSALEGVNILLLISSSEVGQRALHHAAVIAAAKRANIRRIVYTSVLHANTSELSLAPEHKASEEALVASGVPYTILRNGWYIENYTAQMEQYLQRGAIVHATHGGKISFATRSDYAEAAAVVMTTDGHINSIYELGGTAFTVSELADAISEVTGTKVVSQDVDLATFRTILQSAGLDETTAGFVASFDEAMSRGDLYTTSDDLIRLIERPSTPLHVAMRESM